MKTQNLSITLAVIFSLIAIISCSKNDNDIPNQKSNQTTKILRPVAELPDLIIDDIYVKATIFQNGSDFKIPLKVIEKNTSTKVSLNNSIYIFQRISTALNGFYINQLTGKFPKSTNLLPSESETVTGDVFVPNKFIEPVARKINLWAKADGGRLGTELSETNNFSIILWGIYMLII
jgi:hypothetical protein